MPELQMLYHTMHQAPSFYLSPALLQHRALEEQVELWWFREPRRSVLCYCASVALILGLGLGGVGLLSTSTSLSGEWRLGVGTTLCLLALAVLLKQLLSSAIQDMNCVHNRRRIDQLKSGGRADPMLMVAVGLAVMLCGTVLLFVAVGGRQAQDRRDMMVSGFALMAAGAGMTSAVVAYKVMVLFKRKRRRRMMMMMMGTGTSFGTRTVRVFTVTGGQFSQARREASTSRTSLI
ncbi:transmembrane protein 125 [Gouania willdenowi]|uniref:Transmembrane protein 125-like n=1 Tax=Gouania willdenowi TaxID=441366 RepID=A0A8C5HWX6_GOUWI|nr:transmembrane protein 125-like [Gouania willdenowi]